MWTTLGDRRLSAVTAEVGRNQDGRLDALALGTDNEVYWTTQTVPGSWAGSTWQPIQGSPQLRGLTLAQDADARLKVVAPGIDGHVYELPQPSPGTWKDARWAELNRSPVSQAVGVHHGSDGQLHIFVLGQDNGVYELTPQSAPDAGTWRSLGAPARVFVPSFDPGPAPETGRGTDRLAVAENADARLELFSIAADDRVYHLAQSGPGTWLGANWTDLGGGPTISRLAAIRHTDGRLIVLAVGQDDHLYHIAQSPAGGWATSAWQRLIPGDGRLASPALALAANAAGAWEAYFCPQQAAGGVWQCELAPGGTWTAPEALPLGSDAPASMAAAMNADSRLEIIADMRDGLVRASQLLPGNWA